MCVVALRPALQQQQHPASLHAAPAVRTPPQVYAAATVAPVDSASNSKAATSVLGINVFEWPATWGPQPPAAKAQATTAIQPVQTLAGMAAAASGAGCGGAADDKCLL